MKGLAFILALALLAPNFAQAIQEVGGVLVGTTYLPTNLTERTLGTGWYAKHKDIIEPVAADIERFQVDGTVSAGLQKAFESLAQAEGKSVEEVYAAFAQ